MPCNYSCQHIWFRLQFMLHQMYGMYTIIEKPYTYADFATIKVLKSSKGTMFIYFMRILWVFHVLTIYWKKKKQNQLQVSTYFSSFLRIPVCKWTLHLNLLWWFWLRLIPRLPLSFYCEMWQDSKEMCQDSKVPELL